MTTRPAQTRPVTTRAATTRTRAEVLITQSLIDRLTGYEDWPTTRSLSLRMYREGIKRDVEWLLNSRKPYVAEVEKYELVSSSVFNFGLPDVSQLYGQDANAVLLAILQSIRTYETRIQEPRVYLVATDKLSRSLRFHVEGRLMFENGEEEIAFDTLLEIASGAYEVK